VAGIRSRPAIAWTDPTLLVVGETDGAVRELNERAEPQFPRTAHLAQVPGASVLREEPEAMALVAELARD